MSGIFINLLVQGLLGLKISECSWFGVFHGLDKAVILDRRILGYNKIWIIY